MQEKALQEMISEQDPELIYEILDILGEGSYGSVYKALHKQSSELFAIKIVNVLGEAESLQREISILKECQSQYIVRYYGAYTKNNYLWLVMEYCAAGSVIDLIRITKKTLNEFQIASIAYSTLKGLEYLHSNKKIHRDIKGGNILLDHKGNSKLTDFGVSAQLTCTLADKDSVIGTPFWMSPEVISRSRYNKKTDIWSLGITCIELCEGEPPFSNIHPVRAMFVIKNHPPQGLTNPEQSSPEFNDFIQQCLTIDPDKRPESKDLLKHDFMKKALGKQVLQELVMDAQPEIEKHRVMETRKYRDRNNSQQVNEEFNSMVVKDDGNTGTIIEYKQNKNTKNYDFDTMIEHKHDFELKDIDQENDDLKYHYIMYGKQNNNQNTILVKNDIDQPKNLDFVDYVKKMEGAFDNNQQYIDNHFSQKKADIFDKDDMPDLQQMDINQIQQKIKKLIQDKEMEIDLIEQRYNKRIEQCENAIQVQKDKQLKQYQSQPQNQQYQLNSKVKNDSNGNSVINSSYNNVNNSYNNINNSQNNNFNQFKVQCENNQKNNNVKQLNKSNNLKVNFNDIKKNQDQQQYFLKDQYKSDLQSDRNNNSKIEISKSKHENSNITKESDRIKEIFQKNKNDQKQPQIKLQIQKNDPSKIQIQEKEYTIQNKIQQQQNSQIRLAPQPQFLNILKKNNQKINNPQDMMKQKPTFINKAQPQQKIPLTPQNNKKKNDIQICNQQDNFIAISVNNSNLNNQNNMANNYNSNNNLINNTNIGNLNQFGNNLNHIMNNNNTSNQNITNKIQEFMIKDTNNQYFGQYAQQINAQKNKKDIKKPAFAQNNKY